MKKILLLLLFLITPVIMIACQLLSINNTKESDTEYMNTLDTHNSETEIDNKEYVDATKDLTIRSGDSILKFVVKANKLYCTELCTVSMGKNVLLNTPCSLPKFYTANKNMIKTEFDWKYKTAYIFENKKNETGFVVVFYDEKINVTYEMYITARTEMAGPFEIYGYLKNSSAETILVQPNEYFSMSVTGNEAPTAWTFEREGWIADGVEKYDGIKYEGTGIVKTRISSKTVKAYCYETSVYHNDGMLPIMYIDYGNWGMYFAQEWTNGILTATPQNGGTGDILLTAALQEYGEFSTYVNPDNTLFFPNLYIGVYDGDVDTGSNIFKHWFLHYKAPDCLIENEDEPLTQSDLICDTNVEEQATRLGYQSLKIDYGWWNGKYLGTWWSCEGLLEEGSHFISQYGYNIKMACAMAKQYGATIALYYLPSDTLLDKNGVPTSIGNFGHPEWFSNVSIPNGINANADFGNEECVAFFQKYMTDFFNEYGITTWRSDFEPICSTSDKSNRHKANGNDVQYWCTIGFGELIGYLSENVEGFRYECCSSGGMMKDLYIATKAVVINCDDTAAYDSLHTSFYDSSYVFNPCQLQLPCSTRSYTKGDDTYVGTADFVYGLRCTLTGAVHTGKWYSEFDEWEKKYLEYYINLYNTKMKNLIKYGDLWHILPRPDGINWDGIQYSDADTKRETKGLVMIWKPTDAEGDTKTVKLRGLKSDVSYQLTFEDRPEQNCVITGSELMENGLTVTISEDMGSEMIWITEKT